MGNWSEGEDEKRSRERLQEWQANGVVDVFVANLSSQKLVVRTEIAVGAGGKVHEADGVALLRDRQRLQRLVEDHREALGEQRVLPVLGGPYLAVLI